MDERLYKFARLVETGSFTKAAQLLHISQPALSIAIDKLERELGAELLIRSHKKLEITAAGKVAYQAALDQQNVADRLQTNLARLAKQRPQVYIGMTDSIASRLCTTESFEELESDSDVTLVVNNSRYLREAVQQRQLDMAYVIDDGAEHPPLTISPAGTEELLLVCHPQMLQAATDNLGLGKLQNFICYDKPSTTYRHIWRTLRAAHIKPYTTLLSSSPDVMLRMVLRGNSVAALPKLQVQEYLKRGELAELPIIIQLPVSRVELVGKVHTPVLQAFIENVESNK